MNLEDFIKSLQDGEPLEVMNWNCSRECPEHYKVAIEWDLFLDILRELEVYYGSTLADKLEAALYVEEKKAGFDPCANHTLVIQ